MCHSSCLQFAIGLDIADVAGKRVLEVGSFDVNGSPRIGIAILGCRDYIGVDMREGPGVDEVCDATNLVERFGPESFDIVISTEMMEHVKDWRAAISNMKRVCKRGGLILITTRSKGFPKHDYPGDFWRYELKDMKTIFSDCEILKLQEDFQAPGVFVLVRKPKVFREVNLSRYKLYGLSVLKTCERETNMETQKATVVLRQYAQGEVKGKKALLKAKEAARSFAASQNRTLVLQDIGRKLVGQETSTVLQVKVDAALVNLVGDPEPEPVDETGPTQITDEGLCDGDAAGTVAAELLATDEDLQARCKEQGLSPVGSREDLIARLIDSAGDAPSPLTPNQD